jgi:hypothetical protein
LRAGRQKVYPVGVSLIFPVAGRGPPRKNAVPDCPVDLCRDHSRRRDLDGDQLAAPAPKDRSRRSSPPSACASLTARPSASGTKGQQHRPGEEAWVIGEHRLSGERKYYLSNLPADADLVTLAATIKARWIEPIPPQRRIG